MKELANTVSTPLRGTERLSAIVIKYVKSFATYFVFAATTAAATTSIQGAQRTTASLIVPSIGAVL